MRDFLEVTGITLIIVLVIALVVALVTIPLNMASYRTSIVKYYAFKQSLEVARQGEMSELERATILNQIIEWNASIETAKYWRGTIFKIFVSKEFAELELLK